MRLGKNSNTKNEISQEKIASNEAGMRAQSINRAQLFEILWTIAHQAPLSIGFSRKEYWSAGHYQVPKQCYIIIDLLNEREFFQIIWTISKVLICKLYHQLIQLDNKNKHSINEWVEDLNGLFFQRRHRDGQKTHEKINITNQEENSNLKKNEISGHTYQNGYHLKAHTIKQMFTRCG